MRACWGGHAPDERHTADYVSSASAYGDDLLDSPLPIDDPAQGFVNWTNPVSSSNRNSPDLLGAIASLFRS